MNSCMNNTCKFNEIQMEHRVHALDSTVNIIIAVYGFTVGMETSELSLGLLKHNCWEGQIT